MGLRSISPKTLIGIKIIIAVVLVTVLVYRIDPNEIYQALRHVRAFYIILSLLLLPLNIFFQFSRWRILVRLAHPEAKDKDILSSLFCGITLGFITPGRLGEFGRSFFIPATQWARLIGLTLLDKLFALMVLFALGLIGITPFLHQNTPAFIWIPLLFSALAFLVLFFILLLSPQLFSSVLLRKQALWKNHPRWRQILLSLELLSTSVSSKLACLAFAQVTTYTLQFYFLVISIHPVPLIAGIAAITAIMWVKTMLPISIGDLGVRESAAIFFLGQLGVPDAAAFDASMLLFAINILLPAILGAFLLLKTGALQQIKL
ncbi:flippase-like domain-containing protein [candidate division KSB1 bacterium]|nr:flippase-like domain-containing protein [candidate division KSB1 bacterium]